jgi:hypothetical protein
MAIASGEQYIFAFTCAEIQNLLRHIISISTNCSMANKFANFVSALHFEPVNDLRQQTEPAASDIRIIHIRDCDVHDGAT